MTVLQFLDAPACGCELDSSGDALVSMDEALKLVLQHVQGPIMQEEVPLDQAVGRVLASPVTACTLAPPFDNSAMDGYAVRLAGMAGQGPWRLSLSDQQVFAGQDRPGPLNGSDAMRIFTGAPVPHGADAVVPQEIVTQQGNSILLESRPKPGQHIRRAGEDFSRGQIVLRTGQKLDARQIALAAAAGHATLNVSRRPRVGLVVTGSEVRATGGHLRASQIFDVNSPMLTAALSAQADLVEAVQIEDDPCALALSLETMARSCDLLVTTGGVSVGAADHVTPVMERLGADIAFQGVAIKPGKPVTFGRLAGVHWLGLPGNPVSAFVTWMVLGTAILRALTGETAAKARRRHVTVVEDITHRPGRCELRPARLVGFDELGREAVAFQSATHSGRVSQLAEADGVVMIPAEAERIPMGGLVEFLPFSAC